MSLRTPAKLTTKPNSTFQRSFATLSPLNFALGVQGEDVLVYRLSLGGPGRLLGCGASFWVVRFLAGVVVRLRHTRRGWGVVAGVGHAARRKLRVFGVWLEVGALFGFFARAAPSHGAPLSFALGWKIHYFINLETTNNGIVHYEASISSICNSYFT